MKILGKVTVAIAATLLAGTPALADYPEKPIRLIVPFGQGGSSAEAARPMVKAINDNDLLGQPITISYVPGAAGTIGARQVKDADADGYTLLLWHVAANGAKALGNVDFGPEAFVPIAGTDEKCFALVARETSEYKTLPELLEAAKAHPETIISADNLGGANHIASVMAESALPGARFRHVQIGDASKTYPALLGGHAEVNGSSVSMTNKENPGLRILGYMADERHPNHRKCRPSRSSDMT